MFAPAGASVGDWQGSVLAPGSLRALRAGLACIGGSAVSVAGTTVTAVGATVVSAGLAGNAGAARAPCALSGGAALSAASAGGTVMSIAVSVVIDVPGGARALGAASTALTNSAVGAAVLALSTMTNASAGGGGCPFSAQMVALLYETSATGASVQPLVVVGTDGSTYAVSAGDVATLAAAAAAATATPSPAPATAAGAASTSIAAVAGGAAAAAALLGAAVGIAFAVVVARRRRASRSKLTGSKPSLVTGHDGDAEAFALKSPMSKPSNSAAAPSFRAVNVQGGAKHAGKQAAADGGDAAAQAAAVASPPGPSAAPEAAAEAAAVDGPLPAGWEEAWSNRRQATYYRSAADGSTTWVRPTLPAGWSAEDDGQGNTYYVNGLTSAKQWETPTAAATADAAPAAAAAADGALPAGWTAMVDEASGATYYMPDDGGESVWEMPTAPTAGHGSG